MYRYVCVYTGIRVLHVGSKAGVENTPQKNVKYMSGRKSDGLPTSGTNKDGTDDTNTTCM